MTGKEVLTGYRGGAAQMGSSLGTGTHHLNDMAAVLHIAWCSAREGKDREGGY